ISATSSAPEQNDLLAMYSEQALLVDAAASVTRLLDAHLDFEHAADAGPARIRRPVIPWRAIRDRALADRRDRSCHVAQIRGAVHLILPQVSADADAELLFATAKCASFSRDGRLR